MYTVFLAYLIDSGNPIFKIMREAVSNVKTEMKRNQFAITGIKNAMRSLLIHGNIFSGLFFVCLFSFLTMPTSYRSSQARDQTHATVAMQATAVMTSGSLACWTTREFLSGLSLSSSNLRYDMKFLRPISFSFFQTWLLLIFFFSSDALVERQDPASSSAPLAPVRGQVLSTQILLAFALKRQRREKIRKHLCLRLSICWRSSKAKCVELDGNCQLAPSTSHFCGLEGKSWQVVPSECDLLAEPVASFPVFPMPEGWGPYGTVPSPTGIEICLQSGSWELWGMG